LAGEELLGERGAVDTGFAHCGERRREIALGEATAVLMGDERVVEVGGSGRPSTICNRRWTGVESLRSAPRTTSVTLLAASSTTQDKW